MTEDSINTGLGGLRRRIAPVYRPTGEEGELVIYAGDLVVTVAEEQHTLWGQLELRLRPRSAFAAHFVGDAAVLHLLVFADPNATVAIPSGASLDPPAGSSLPERPGAASWVDTAIPLNGLEAGSSVDVDRYMLHVTGLLRAHLPSVAVEDGTQPQLVFSLLGWNLVLATVDQPDEGQGFSFVVEATRSSMPATAADVKRLQWRLFILLSLLAGSEVGVGPICGLDPKGRVVWVECGAPRAAVDISGRRWCTEHLVATALPKLATGYVRMSQDEAMAKVLDRGITHLLAIQGAVLDVRIPVTCSGLELLGWAVLQRDGWVGTDALAKLPEGAVLRLVLHWAGIPDAIPDHFHALQTRRGRIGQPDWAGPEVLFNIRNALVHPPKRLDNPEWPDPAELVEAWQLATWYLELVVLRILGYDGQYRSSLHFDRWISNLEQVPWAEES